MAFKKGISGNPEGRRPGSKNKATEQLRDMLKVFVMEGMESLRDDYKKLKPEQRLRFLESLLRHVLSPPVDPDKLTEEQLKQLENYFLGQLEHEKRLN